MIVDKVHEIISFRQSEWLEKNISFDTQKRNKAKNGLEKDIYKLPNISFHGKMMENVRNRLKLNLFKKIILKKLLNTSQK